MEIETLAHFLAAVAKEPSMLTEQPDADFLTRETGRRLCDFMLRSQEDLDMQQPLAALGVTRWWRLRSAIGGVRGWGSRSVS